LRAQHRESYRQHLADRASERVAFAKDFMHSDNAVSRPAPLRKQIWRLVRHPFAGWETTRANELRRRNNVKNLMENIGRIRGRELGPYFVKDLNGVLYDGRNDAFDEQQGSIRILDPLMKQREKLMEELQGSQKSFEEMKAKQPAHVQAVFEKLAVQANKEDPALLQNLPASAIDALNEFNRINKIKSSLQSIHEAEWVTRSRYGAIGTKEDSMLQRLTALAQLQETTEYHIMNHRQRRQELRLRRKEYRLRRRQILASFLTDIIKGLGAAAR
jgi:hypothetical protein